MAIFFPASVGGKWLLIFAAAALHAAVFVALNVCFTLAMHGVSYFMTLDQGRQNAPAAYA